MKRICLLSSVVALFALTAAAEIPAWAERSIAETYARFKAWKGNDEVVVIPTISDIHDFEVESASQPDFARSAFHLLILKRAGEVFKADLTVNLGDLGLDCEGHWAKPSSAAHQAKRLQVEAELVSRFSRPHFELIGNHDHGAATNRITSADFGHLLNPASASRVKGFVSGSASRDYGYFDFPAKGVRAILLNTSDAIPNTYAISDEQLAFLRHSLAELGKGDNPKRAVIFCHYCIYQQLGRWDASWRANGCKLLGGNLPLAKAAIEEFAQRSDGTRLVGVFCGDSHFSCHLRENGVRWAITQGFGGVSPKEIPTTPAPGVSLGWINRSEETLLDVVAYKPATDEFRVFRIGKGGSAADITAW